MIKYLEYHFVIFSITQHTFHPKKFKYSNLGLRKVSVWQLTNGFLLKSQTLESLVYLNNFSIPLSQILTSFKVYEILIFDWHHLSHLMRLWYFSSSVNSFFTGWLGWAMVLGSFQYWGILLLLHKVWQGPAVLAAGAGWVGYVYIFFFILSSFSKVLSFGRLLNMTNIVILAVKPQL